MKTLIRLFGLLAFLSVGLHGLPAQAQSPAEVEKLVSTLENPAERAKLVGQLKLLLKAQATQSPASAAAKAPAAASDTAPSSDVTETQALLTAIPDKIEESVWALILHWGGGAAQFLSQGIPQRIIGSAISIVSALILTQIVWRVVSGAIRRYLERTDKDGNALERSRRTRTLLPLFRLVVRVILTVMVVMIILSELGVNIAPLLAGAGVIGVAVGFGSQRLVQDIITGIFILIEDTISIGDVVRIDSNHSGTVESMSIRALQLRDGSGNLHSVPFSSVGSVTNMSKGFAYALFDIGIAYSEDVDRVTAVLSDLGDEMSNDAEWNDKIIAPLEVLGLDRFDASAVIIRVRFKTKAAQQWPVTREFNRRIKRRFDAEKIEFPFPQTTLWFGETADGSAPAAKIKMLTD